MIPLLFSGKREISGCFEIVTTILTTSCVISGFVGRFYVPRTLLSNILRLLSLKTDVRLLSRFVVKPKKKEGEMLSSKSDTSNGFDSTLDSFTFAKGTYAASTYLNSVILQASTCLQLFKSR